MIFKPVNEKHLEHLVSSDFFQKNCNLEYIGPVLLPNNSVLDSPDMLLLDKRKSSLSFKTCECKFSPTSFKDFAHNGEFDIAIIWECNIDLEKLKVDLFKHNKCNEVIVLSKLNIFNKLPQYKNFQNKENEWSYFYIDKLKHKLSMGKEYTSFVAYIAASIYPKRINKDKLRDLLNEKFESVRKLNKRGQSNSYSALTQVIGKGNPERILSKKGENTYQWNNELIDSKIGLSIISKFISDYFYGKFPSEEDINRVEVN